MLTKRELDETIDQVAANVRKESTLLYLASPLGRKGFETRTNEILDEIASIEKSLLTTTDGSPELIDIQSRIFAIEGRYKRWHAFQVAFPSVIGIYLGFFLIFFILVTWNIPEFVKNVLGVQAPEKLISFGIAGAFIYLATSLITRFDSAPAGSSGITRGLNIALRLSLAIVVPIILVGLFFTQDGQIAQLKISPELLAFASGYSVKLVIDIIAKVIEKGTKMIESI